MRAVVISEPGGPAVLTVADREVRPPGEGEVAIRVKAAAVNPTDVLGREMGYGDVPEPWTPGMDAAGVIETVGPGVDRFSPGDEVMAGVTPRRQEGGAQQELLVVAAVSVVPIPDGASLEAAATLPMNGLTAKLGLELLGVTAGDTLGVSGGAGLLASYVIPLAKAMGLTVIADAKPEDAELVRGFGADTVVPRGPDLAAVLREVVPDGVDAVFDTATMTSQVVPGIRDGGAIAVVRGWPDDEPEPDRDIRVAKVMVATALDRTQWLEELRELAGDGRIQLRPDRTFPPEEAAAAQELMDAGGLRGRALIVF